MNNTFDFRRFVQVCRLAWQTQPILPYIVLLAMIPLLLFFFAIDAHSAYIELKNGTPFTMFNVYLFTCGWLYAGLAFGELGKPGGAARCLLLPASTLEKWLAKSLLVWIVFPFIIWVAYNIVFVVFGWMSLQWMAFRYSSIDWSSVDVKVSLFIFYVLLPAAYASGLAWKRLGVLKGLVLFIVLFIVLFQLGLMGTGGFSFTMDKSSLLEQVSMTFFDTGIDSNTQALVRLFWATGVFIPWLLLLLSTYFFTRERTL